MISPFILDSYDSFTACYLEKNDQHPTTLFLHISQGEHSTNSPVTGHRPPRSILRLVLQ